jgi:HAD superfamily hydrolase (TIGR01509 family)
MHQSVQAILLDYDGTIVDSETVYFQLWNAVLQPYGVQLSAVEYGRYLLGHTNQRNAEDLRTLFGVPASADELVTVMESAMRDYQSTALLPLTAGARQGIIELHGRSRRLAVVSSNSREFILHGLGQHDLLQYVEVVVARDDVQHRKPAPDPYLHALNKLGLNAADCIAVEDTILGLQSAHGAGLQCLQFSSPFTQTHTLPGVLDSIASLEEVSGWLQNLQLPAA